MDTLSQFTYPAPTDPPSLRVIDRDLAAMTVRQLYAELDRLAALWCGVESCPGCLTCRALNKAYDAAWIELDRRPSHRAVVTRLAKRMREGRL